MKKNKDNEIIVIDSKGKEYKMNILFTYENENRKTSYVFFYDPNDEENVIVMKYNDKNELEDVADDEEYSELEEVFNSYNSKEEENN